jgi:hypothetical protein
VESGNWHTFTAVMSGGGQTEAGKRNEGTKEQLENEGIAIHLSNGRFTPK